MIQYRTKLHRLLSLAPRIRLSLQRRGLRALARRSTVKIAHRLGWEIADPYQDWVEDTLPEARALTAQRHWSNTTRGLLSLTLIIRSASGSRAKLARTLRTLRQQTYGHWSTVVLADGDSEQELSQQLSESGADFLGVLEAGDTLSPEALYEFARAILAAGPQPDVLYCDEDRLASNGRTRRSPIFKPSWSPDTALGCHYTGRLTLARLALVREVGGYDPSLGDAAEWDLLLRLSERTDRIVRIPLCLLHRGGPVRCGDVKLRQRVLQAHLERTGMPQPHAVEQPNQTFRVGWSMSRFPTVSVIIPTVDKPELISRCVHDLREKTDYPNLEIILVDSGSTDPRTRALYDQWKRSGWVSLVEWKRPFNYSAACNRGAASASGELLLFLNNDMEVMEADWLEELVRWADRPGVGVVGTKLLYPHGTIQHAGVGLQNLGTLLFVNGSDDRSTPPPDTLFGTPNAYRNVSAVIGACQIVKRSLFNLIGGYDERSLIACSDVILCVRAAQLGYRCCYTPYAALVHHEGSTRGHSNPDEDLGLLASVLRETGYEEDPYVHPDLDYRDVQPGIRPIWLETSGEQLRRRIVEMTPFVFPREPVAIDPAWSARPMLRRLSTRFPLRAASAESVGQSSADAAWFVIELLLHDESVSQRFPHALSAGADGPFCRWLCTEAIAQRELPGATAETFRLVFESQPGSQVSRLLDYRGFENWSLRIARLPHLIDQLGAWLLQNSSQTGMLHQQIWWFLLEAAESPVQNLIRTYLVSPGWQKHFPDALGRSGWSRLNDWLRIRYGLDARECDISEYVPSIAMDRSQAGFGPWPAGDLPSPPAGLNILAHFCTPCGIQASAVSVQRSLEMVGVGTSCRDVITEARSLKLDRSPYLGLEVYPQTLIHIQPDAFFDRCYERAELVPRSGIYKIGMWYWEFAKVPPRWKQAVESIDEFWAPSRFVARAMRETFDVPVIELMPGVQVGEIAPFDRARLRIPGTHTFFLFIFDAGSVTERKNPQGVIEAFRRAFRADDDATLVIKAGNLKKDPHTGAVLREAARASATLLLEEHLPRSELNGLMQACDCYVSLHRSEGFGLTMAEAMLLGKPVIGTAYSANTEFMDSSNSLLVDYKLVPVGRQLGPYSDDLIWAEPSIEQAAEAMRWVHENRDQARRLGEEARNSAEDRLSLRAAGQRFAPPRRDQLGSAGQTCVSQAFLTMIHEWNRFMTWRQNTIIAVVERIPRNFRKLQKVIRQKGLVRTSRQGWARVRRRLQDGSPWSLGHWLKQHRRAGLAERLQQLWRTARRRTRGSSSTDYQGWINETEPTSRELARQRRWSRTANDLPQFLLIITKEGCSAEDASRTERSLRRQTYDRWMPVFTQSLSTLKAEQTVFDSMKYNFVGVMQAGDTLSPEALYEFARAAIELPHDRPAMIYCDEDHLAADGWTRSEPILKPAWSSEMLLGYDYMGRLTLFRRDLMEQAGGFDPELGEAALWDLKLRVSCLSQHITRITRCLYHNCGETDPRPLNRSEFQGRSALLAHVARQGITCSEAALQANGTFRVRWPLTEHPLVSVIIPTVNSPHRIDKCVRGLIEATGYPNKEIILVDNGSTCAETLALYDHWLTEAAVKTISFDRPFNYSAACNAGADAATGDYLLFLNNDIEFPEPDWLEELLMWAQRPGVGIVGPRMIHPSGQLNHAGIAVTLDVYLNLYIDQAEARWGIFGHADTYRNFSGLLGACHLMSRTTYNRLGGYDERYLLVCSDIAICLESCRAGLRNVYTPYSLLIHDESTTRKGLGDPADDRNLAAAEILRHGYLEDPYFHPALGARAVSPRLRSSYEPSSVEYFAWLRTKDNPRAVDDIKLDIFDDTSVRRVAGTWPAGLECAPVTPERIAADVDSAARFIVHLLRADTDLRRSFPNALSAGSEGDFCRWLCSPEGQSRYGLSSAAVTRIRATFETMQSSRIRQLYEMRVDLQLCFPLAYLAAGRGRFFRWLITEGREEIDIGDGEIWWFLLECDEDQARELIRTYLNSPWWQRFFPDALTLPGWGRFTRWLEARHGVAAIEINYRRYSGLRPIDELHLAYGCRGNWRRDFPDALQDTTALNELLNGIREHEGAADQQLAEWTRQVQNDLDESSGIRQGINVLAFFCYPHGLQESASSYVRCLRLAGTPVSCRDVPILISPENRKRDEFLGLEIFDTTLIHVQPESHFSNVYERALLAPRPDTHRIAVWWWETDAVPDHWRETARSVHELWAASRFVTEGLRKTVEVPVFHMPLGYETGPVRNIDLASYGVPAGSFVFLFIFDFNSTLAQESAGADLGLQAGVSERGAGRTGPEGLTRQELPRGFPASRAGGEKGRRDSDRSEASPGRAQRPDCCMRLLCLAAPERGPGSDTGRGHDAGQARHRHGLLGKPRFHGRKQFTARWI